MGSAVLSMMVLLGALYGGARSTDVWVDREVLLMGARLRAEVEAPAEAEAQRVIDRLFDAVGALEKKWTTWETGSELSDLRAAELGAPIALSEDTFELLARAWNLADRTDGAFEPTVGPLLAAWGLSAPERAPTPQELDVALASVGRRCFDLSPAARTISKHCPDAWIDGGGFGKGAALSAIEAILDEEGVVRARIDFGGQLLVRGSDPAQPRTMGITDPRHRDRVAFQWPMQDGSVATSRQSQTQVVDPRSGLPIEDWGSVTVQSDDPIEADGIATALFVMGPEDGIRWLAARPHIRAVLLVASEDSVTACGTERLVQSLTPVGPGAVRSEAALISDMLRACPVREVSVPVLLEGR